MLKHKSAPKLVVIALLIGALTTWLFFALFSEQRSIVYVDSVKLFEGFKMTKEMKRVGEKEFNERKILLDNLYASLQGSSLSVLQKKELMQQFIQGKEELEQFNQTFASEQTQKIWSRIRSYTSEFSKDKNYQLIVGSDNKQMVLFADEKIDVTNDLLTYLNKKYEGI
ncbi:Outer membrane protein (OmpH-like) [compost metagenome]|jgi:outer membrane protein